MNILPRKTDERVEVVYFTRDALVVDLMDGRTISVPLHWYPKLLKATTQQRANWITSGGGYGIHWPEIDEDLSTHGLLLGSPAPIKTMNKTPRIHRKQNVSSANSRLKRKKKTKVN